MNSYATSSKIQSKFSSCGAIYPFTTERLDQYLPKCIRPQLPVFTVCGSGDQILNSILLGARDISAFDINVRALWWSELKISAVRRLEFSEFKSFFLPSCGATEYEGCFDTGVYNRIRGALSLPARRFFDLSFLSKHPISAAVPSFLFDTRRYSEDYAVRANLYLQDEIAFKTLKKAIGQTYLRYLNVDVLAASNSLLATDATVLLSNLADYPFTYGACGTGSFAAFLRSVVLPFQNSKGSKVRVVAAYMYEISSSQRLVYHSEVDDPKIRRRECSRYLPNFWEITFPGMGSETVDGVLISDATSNSRRGKTI